MASPNVLRKVQIDGKWLMLPVSKDGPRLDWQHVDLHGVPVVSVTGTFYLDYRENGKRIRRAVGTHPRDAKAALAAQSSVLQLRSAGIAVDDAPQIQAYRPVSGEQIADVIAEWLRNPPLKLRSRSRAKYANALKVFGKWTTKTHLSELSRVDINNFMSHLVLVDGLDKSTAFDKAVVVQAVMNEHGAQIKMNKGDWPRSTERQPDIYDADILRRLFAAATPQQYVLFQTFLMTGFRDQEVGYLSWEDFNPRNNTLRVSEKVTLGFAPKNYQERTIPIPDKLVKLLQNHRKTLEGNEYLIFPTSRSNAYQGRPGGQRNRHMLDELKALALQAGLNCGHCSTIIRNAVVTCRTAKVCTRFGLHKFRHTYATTLLRDGVDLLSLQKLLGHADLESTRKYLRSLEPDDLLAKLKRTSISTRFG